MNQQISRAGKRCQTYIFMVPFGPRFDLRTSCKPMAAAMLMASACPALATSALGFNNFTAAILYNRKFKKRVNVNFSNAALVLIKVYNIIRILMFKLFLFKNTFY